MSYRRLIRGLLPLAAGLLLGACAGQPPGAQASGPEQLVRDAYAAFARGDMAAVQAVMADDLVWYEAEGLAIGGVYESPQAVMENIFAQIGAEWDSYSAEPGMIIASGQRVAVWGRYQGVHRESGGRLDVPFAHLWIIDKGKLVEFHQLTDTVLFNAAIAGEAAD